MTRASAVDGRTGIRCMMMRGGTSKGLYFEPNDLPADQAERDDLLLRLMGSPDPRQIDGLGGSTSLTSKVAIVSPSQHPDIDVDYLFLQIGVDGATVSNKQNCGNILAGVGPFAVERGLVPIGGEQTSVRIRMVNSDSTAVATFPTPCGAVEYGGEIAIAGVPGTAAPVLLAFSDTEGSATGSLLPTGRVLEDVEGIPATLVDNGMPVALALASSFGCTGDESPETLAADEDLAARIDAFRTEAGRRMGLGDVSGSSVPKTVLLSPATDGGQVRTLSFIPVRPHAAIGVLAAVSTVTGILLKGSVGHRLADDWPVGTSQVDVEHPSGHLLVDVVIDDSLDPARVTRSGVLRTARKLFDGTAFPRG